MPHNIYNIRSKKTGQIILAETTKANATADLTKAKNPDLYIEPTMIYTMSDKRPVLPAAAVVPTGPTIPPMPTVVPAGWRTVMAEDFDKPAALGKFSEVYGKTLSIMNGGQDTNEKERVKGRQPVGGIYNTDQTATVLDGTSYVDIEVGKPMTIKNADGTNSISKTQAWVAALTPKGWNGSKKIRIEFCMQDLDVNELVKKAPLLWPTTDRWKGSGERDIAEGRIGFKSPNNFNHSNINPDKHIQLVHPLTNIDPLNWHVYAYEGVAGEYSQFECDGKIIARDTNPEFVAVDPERFVLQLETEIGIKVLPAHPARVRLFWLRQLEGI